jgi:hypothetical protein
MANRRDKSTHDGTGQHSLSRSETKKNKRLANKRQRRAGKVQF